jgi:DNA-binding Lrp family transcriptional regulator
LAGKLDKFDLRLLACLQESNLQTADALAEKVGRSPSVIARRLRRLRASGVVIAESAVISEKAAGFPLSAVVHVQFEHHDMHDVEEFRRRVCASPNVQLCLNLAGAFDILLLVVAEDMDAYNRFTASFLERRPVLRFETTLVKKRVKATLALPFGLSL